LSGSWGDGQGEEGGECSQSGGAGEGADDGEIVGAGGAAEALVGAVAGDQDGVAVGADGPGEVMAADGVEVVEGGLAGADRRGEGGDEVVLVERDAAQGDIEGVGDGGGFVEFAVVREARGEGVCVDAVLQEGGEHGRVDAAAEGEGGAGRNVGTCLAELGAQGAGRWVFDDVGPGAAGAEDAGGVALFGLAEG
jgi:hypothetical protein